MSRKVGFQKDLPEGWKGKGRDLASSGCTETEVHASFGLSVPEHEEMKEGYPLYQQEVERWIAMGMAFYLKLGRDNLTNKNFNYKEWVLTMEHVFGWREKEPEEKPKVAGKKDVDATPKPVVPIDQMDNISRFRNPKREIKQPEENNG